MRDATTTAPPSPSLAVTSDTAEQVAADALVVPVFRGAIEGPGTEAALRALGLSEIPRDHGFRGDVGEVQTLLATGLPWRRVVLVGVGRIDGLSDEVLRRAAGAATRTLGSTTTSIVTTLALTNPTEAAVRAVAEGALLGSYRYDRYRSEPDPARLDAITLIVPSALADAAQGAIATARVHATAECLARDLVNTPAGDLGPSDLVDQALAACPDLDAEVWDVPRLEAERCGGILGVGRGSPRPPRMLILRYQPEEPTASVVLVGKGIVFDTGGLSLKRPPHMIGMHYDMAGAAAVIATMSALADLGVPVAVTGVCAIAENAVSGTAHRPGDVVTARDGTSIEVRNTDAEGRLALADALSYAAELEPDAIVDLATLTGGVKYALGARATAAFGNDDDLLRQILGAAESAGEPTWHLPLWEDLRPNIDADVADLDNLGRGDSGDSTIGGLFLREFVADIPWVHLDTGASAWATTARNHLPKAATGAGVRTLLRWLELA